MKRFTELFVQLDSTTKTNEKVAAMVAYFEEAAPANAAWAVFFLSGRRFKRLLSSGLLRTWAAELAGIPEWLLVESYGAVGDSAETAALLAPSATRQSDLPLQQWIEHRILALMDMDDDEKREAVSQWWSEVDEQERFVLNKLLTGGLRVGVSQRLMTRALSRYSGIEEPVIAHRLMGTWEATPAFFEQLIAEDQGDADASRPYPYYLAYALEGDVSELGAPDEWLAEWKWDGIRAQLIRRQGRTFLWSRGEELVTDRYPEVAAAAASLPDGTVLDGELLPWKGGRVMPFAQLQRRIGRKKVGKKLRADVPVIFLAFDVLELDVVDIRSRPQTQRRGALRTLIEQAGEDHLLLSEAVAFDSWDELAERMEESRDRRVEGVMLKRRESVYRVGRKRGDWWKWKVDPYTVDCVMIYAQRGSGRRASLYTDYTFAVWHEGELVPFAKAYSGLTDEEIRQVDRFVRQNTRERFGPVRSVKPELVFELAFENIQRSTRHKSGVAVRFPRIVKWRQDLNPSEADDLDTIKSWIVDG